MVNIVMIVGISVLVFMIIGMVQTYIEQRNKGIIIGKEPNKK